MRSETQHRQIDPRSFHVFDDGNIYFLFDRATGHFLTIDANSYAVLFLIERGTELSQALDNVANAMPDELANQFRAAFMQQITTLIDNAFFRYTAVDLREQDRMIKRLLRHKRRRLQLLAAQGCNFGCRYCYAWRNGSNHKNTLMPINVGRAAVDFLIVQSAHRKDLNITFFGGEALMNFALIEDVVSYARSLEGSHNKRFHFDITTNGTLLTPAIAQYLLTEDFRVMISIDGYEEMHNHNRPTLDKRNAYQEIVDNALYLNALFTKHDKAPPKIRANLTEQHHDYCKTGRHLRELGFERVSVAIIEPLPHTDQSPSALTEDSADKLQRENFTQLRTALTTLASGGELHKFDAELLAGYTGLATPGKLKGLSCGTGRNTQTVDVKGNIFPCHRYEGMENYAIGNVFTGIDNGALLEYYTKVNKNATNRCHSCWIRDYCQGGCAWLLSAKDGHIADPTERECNRRRRSFEMSLWTNYQITQLPKQRLPLPSKWED